MTVTVRQIKNKDGTTTSDINGVHCTEKETYMKEGLFQELRERSFFNQEVKEQKSKSVKR